MLKASLKFPHLYILFYSFCLCISAYNMSSHLDNNHPSASFSTTTATSASDDQMAKIPHLPAEIWLMILSYLPPSFFQQDIRRLCLFKHWYSLAFPRFYPQIEFTPRVVSRLVHVQRKSKNIERSKALLKKSLRSVNIVLAGIPPIPPCENDQNIRFNTTANLPKFAHELLEFQELKSLRFHAGHANQAWKGDPFQCDYLPLKSIEPYLSLLSTHVTSMDIDLCGTNVTGVGGSNGGGMVHFCSQLRPLLTRLLTLKVRLRSICGEALRPLGGGKVSVKNLTVDLFLGRVSEVNPKLNCSGRCLRGMWEPVNRWNSWRGWVDPVGPVMEGLLKLVKKMERPGKVELVHLDALSGEVHRWDALSGRKGRCVRDKSEEVFDCFWVSPELRWGRKEDSCFETESSDGELVDTDDEF
ncbi:hypothetical protein QBC44DRAFT_325274 [Cladorrhinum sp. PSN332]|nr:hypothetical protein QBC44DRAFT_325274 [Cladorrhinum sp. PSN332]